MSKPGTSSILSGSPSDPSIDVDLLPQAVLLIDEHHVVRNANQTWTSLYCHDAASSLGRSFFQYIHPKDRPHTHGAVEKIWDSGSMANCVVRILDGASADRWSDIYLRYHDVDGKPFIVASISDISERIGEERLLLAQHRSINSILNDLPGMVYRCRNNPEWPMEYVSEGCVELTGYQARDIVHSRKLSYGSMIVADDKEPVWEEVQNALREHRRFELIYKIRTAGGETKWVWEKGKGIYSAEGELSGIEGFITDFGRQITCSGMDHIDGASTDMPGGAQFTACLEEGMNQLEDFPDLRLMLFCIHLDRYERYMAGAGHEKLMRGQRYVAETLRSIIRPGDVLYASQPNRWFIMQLRARGDADPEGGAEAVSDAFLSPILLGEQQVYVSASIGCVVVRQRGNNDARRIMRHASRAMSTCHAAGGGAVEVLHL